MIRVIVTDPDGLHWVHNFSDRTRLVSVGRHSTNDVQVDDPRASRRQLVLRREHRGWLVEDTSGRGRTSLNGLGLDGPTRLSHGDEVTFGSTTLVLEGDAPRTPGARTAGETWSGAAVTESHDDIHESSVSTAFRSAVRLARRIAPTTETVLIRGETGTGKEVLARIIHEASERAQKPLVVVNCPGLSDSLFESELFGVEKGVATGVEPRPGRLAQADGGTVLLDEIGDLPVASQAKLLRFLQDKTVDRVGGTAPIPVDVRVLAATNVDLEAAIDAGRFRGDLFHRLSALTISLPPLRERREDIPALAQHFLKRTGDGRSRLDEAALALLERYPFPGNVRELELVMRQAALLAEGPVIGPENLPERIRNATHDGSTESPGATPDDDARRLYASVVENGEDFWNTVRAPFLRRELSRRPIQSLVARAISESDGTYAGAARLFRVQGEYRKFVDFLRHNLLRPEDP